LTTLLINNKGTKVCSRFRFSALFFNLEASLQQLIPAKDKSSCLLYIKANTIAVKKCEHTFHLRWEIWYFGSSWVKRSVVKSRGARGAIFQKMSHCDYRLKGGEYWLKQHLLQLVIIACTKFEKRN
jgi:hypothetical protein